MGVKTLTVMVLTGAVVVPAVGPSVIAGISFVVGNPLEPEGESGSGFDELGPVLDPVSCAGGLGSIVGLSSAGMVGPSGAVIDGSGQETTSVAGPLSCAGGLGSVVGLSSAGMIGASSGASDESGDVEDEGSADVTADASPACQQKRSSLSTSPTGTRNRKADDAAEAASANTVKEQSRQRGSSSGDVASAPNSTVDSRRSATILGRANTHRRRCVHSRKKFANAAIVARDGFVRFPDLSCDR